MPSTRAPLLDRLFFWIVLVKGIDGIFEVLSGAALLALGPNRLGSWGTDITARVLDADPDNALAQAAQTSLLHLTSSATLFAGIYLLVHGIVKLVLWWAVGRRRYGVYPAMIGVLSLFVLYQVVELARAWSVGLVVLTVFDVVIIVLTWVEWRRHAARRGRAGAGARLGARARARAAAGTAGADASGVADPAADERCDVPAGR